MISKLGLLKRSGVTILANINDHHKGWQQVIQFWRKDLLPGLLMKERSGKVNFEQ